MELRRTIALNSLTSVNQLLLAKSAWWYVLNSRTRSKVAVPLVLTYFSASEKHGCHR